MTRIMINLDRSGGRGAPMAALQTSLGVCSGSGLNPSRYPEFADHQYVECHKCGQVVRVTQRYYDGPRDVRNLALATHELPTERGSKP